MIFSYNNSHKADVLKAFGFDIVEGKVVEKSTGNEVKDNLGTLIDPKRFGGIRKGSIEIINKDVSSLIRLRKKLRGK